VTDSPLHALFNRMFGDAPPAPGDVGRAAHLAAALKPDTAEVLESDATAAYLDAIATGHRPAPPELVAAAIAAAPITRPKPRGLFWPALAVTLTAACLAVVIVALFHGAPPPPDLPNHPITAKSAPTAPPVAEMARGNTSAPAMVPAAAPETVPAPAPHRDRPKSAPERWETVPGR